MMFKTSSIKSDVYIIDNKFSRVQRSAHVRPSWLPVTVKFARNEVIDFNLECDDFGISAAISADGDSRIWPQYDAHFYLDYPSRYHEEQVAVGNGNKISGKEGCVDSKLVDGWVSRSPRLWHIIFFMLVIASLLYAYQRWRETNDAGKAERAENCAVVQGKKLQGSLSP